MYSYIPACRCVVLLYCCCCSSCCLLLLFVIVCRMVKFVPVVHCIWFQCFLSLHSNTIYFQCTPWQYCRISSVDFLTFNTYHTSSVLRACAEPRRALDRRDGSPLVYIRIVFYFSSHLLSSPFFFSLPPRRNSDPGSHSRLFFHPPHYGSCLGIFIARRFQLFLPLWTRVESYRLGWRRLDNDAVKRLYMLLTFVKFWYFFAQISSYAHRSHKRYGGRQRKPVRTKQSSRFGRDPCSVSRRHPGFSFWRLILHQLLSSFFRWCFSLMCSCGSLWIRHGPPQLWVPCAGTGLGYILTKLLGHASCRVPCAVCHACMCLVQCDVFSRLFSK